MLFRSTHNAIMETREALADRYALVNVETDRITTSVNTLREQVNAWTAMARNKR